MSQSTISQEEIGRKRKSRFASNTSAEQIQPSSKRVAAEENNGNTIDINAAALRAAEISRQLSGKVHCSSSYRISINDNVFIFRLHHLLESNRPRR